MGRIRCRVGACISTMGRVRLSMHDGEREAKYNWEGELRIMARESVSIYGKQEPEYDGEGDPA